MSSNSRIEQAKRLRQARLAQGRFAEAADAARAMGIPLPTYYNHENGSNGLSRSGQQYAKFYRVNYDWLINGRGPMRGPVNGIPVRGYVGAGSSVENAMADDDVAPEILNFPDEGRAGAFIVRGDSMWPRFMAGEYILFEEEPTIPERLINRYAIVQTLDGRRMLKMLRRGKGENRWRLESHNAQPEDEVQITGVWRVFGVMMP